MISWDETRGKIKNAHDQIESAYEKHVVSAVDKVKERSLLNTAVKAALPLIPIIGPILGTLYDNIGGGAAKSEEDKAKQILDFLSELEQQNKEQFDRITQDLETNRHVIIDAVNDNRIGITDLISRSSAELLEAVGKIKEDTSIIKVGVKRIETLLEKERPAPSELKRPPKPSIFRGESTKIFVGRKQYIDTIKNYFLKSSLPVSITGEGGIGKSELAYKAIHRCEDIFDLIIPVYFGSFLTFESFLLEMAKSLNLAIDEFEKKDLEERRQLIIDTLGQGGFKHSLIYADNYETIARLLSIKDGSAPTSKEEEEQKDNARKINAFLVNLPPNTAVLLTSRERYNLDGERPVRLDGLSETEGRDLFIELAKNHFPKGKESSAEIKKALEDISKKAGGHPLSIELLARSYRGGGLSKIREMLEHMGAGVVNAKEEDQRLQSLESCFEYSLSKLPQIHKDLLSKLTLFDSPFPAEAIKNVFGFEESEILLDLYDHSLLRRIEFDEYSDDLEETYHLYYFHPAIRNYLKRKVKGVIKQRELEEDYREQFSLYYHKLLEETYNAIGTKYHVLSLERFNVIWLGKDNDFDRAIRLAKDKLLASSISSNLGVILYRLGIHSAALEQHTNALTIHEELKDKVGMARDYANIGIVLQEQGNYDHALQYHNKAVTIDEELKDKVGMARDYTNIGIALRYRRDYDQAVEYHKKSLAIHEELKDKVGMARDYSGIGSVLQEQVHFDQAVEYHKKSLAIHEELKDKVGMARDYTNIGIALSNPGKYDQALTYYRKSLAIHEELKDKVGMARDYTNIGYLLADMKYRKAEAIESLSKGLEILEGLEEKTGYHHPSIDSIRRYISRLQQERDEAGY